MTTRRPRVFGEKLGKSSVTICCYCVYGPALLHDSRQSLVCPDRRVLKFPRLFPGRCRSLPFELPGESSRKRSCDDAQGLLGELGILLGGFGESKAVQLRVDLNRRHADIIPSRVETPHASPSETLRPGQMTFGPDKSHTNDTDAASPIDPSGVVC